MNNTKINYWESTHFRHIICMLKHSKMKIHAIWLARHANPKASFKEAKEFVENCSEKIKLVF